MNHIINATNLLIEWYETNDVDLLIKYLGIQLTYFNEQELNIGTHAFSYKDTIFLSSSLNDDYAEFLKLHELAHLLLHQHGPLDCPLAFTNTRCIIERQSNYFALLMLSRKYHLPIKHLANQLQQLFNVNIPIDDKINE